MEKADEKNPDIGYIDCPICGFDGAPVREQKISRRAYINCEECGTQIFSRWTQSNRLIRSRMKPVAAPAAEKPAAAAPAAEVEDDEESTIFDGFFK